MNCYYNEIQGMCIEGNFWQVNPVTGANWTAESAAEYIASYEPKEIDQLQVNKGEAVERIKAAVAKRLTSTFWRVERAQERLELAKLGSNDALIVAATETLQSELLMREKLREASNLAELDVAEIIDIDELNLFNFIPEKYIA
ncbi:hypothetical protein BGP78_06375 [Pseudoalteromonas sp. MSK9-3]|uniref:hypothetical protein n=1 Tax=Pseudoalteromonas sp. MSK9-3 TaxID=1897633 RepID=UPI000E6BA9ED|nr:hypothetical protein [Pseudoalteromonas sp. MSK9-3]RJE78133.1 hypothetical protein BGP78_06375 [Pseudoalteromonas sp. MSK9-3]